jgi:glutamyl-tRNA synthetase
MYSNELVDRLIALLAPNGFTPRQESEACYIPRQLADGAEVMRVPPSPTGFVHIGTIYAGLVNERIAHQSQGVFILRIEDTDKKREVEGSVEAITKAFKDFEISYDEGPDTSGGDYGPYFQSQRDKMYLGYAIDLLQKGRAYPCFATPEELSATVKDQQAKKLRPGYYGEWAIWRDKSEADITAALDAGRPFVLRFRSNGSHNTRIQYTDIFKGKMEVPENDLDVPLIKSDEYRLPTYHLAHVVDDFLMRITKVFRSDEWLPSTALHIELAQALGITPFTYGHFAPISIIDKNGGGKRKLSKRKDDEADVKFWLEAGYPIEAVKAYLLGLANSNFEDWYRDNPGKPVTDFTISLEKLAASRAPLLDMKKLEDYAKQHIASLPQVEFNESILAWARLNSPRFAEAIEANLDYANKVFAIERDGDKPRKDLARWSDAPEQYSYFFDDLYPEELSGRIAEELKDTPAELVTKVCEAFLAMYDPNDSQEAWLAKFRAAAEAQGMKLGDFARIIRVKLSDKNRTPDLYAMLQIMGADRVRNRLS